MLTGNILLVTGLGMAILALTGVQTFFAIMHDRVVTAKGPALALEELEGQIVDRRGRLTDIENDLAERRKALANIADVQADYDATKRQLDDLNAEWNQQDERRKEIRTLREEMEIAIAEKQTFDSELASARADYDAVQERLSAAERLFAQNDEMKREHAALEAKLGELRSEAMKLAEAQERVERLDVRAQDLQRELSQMEGRGQAALAELAQLQERLSTERGSVAEAQSNHTVAAAKTAAAEERARTAEQEVDRLEGRRSSLAAQIARLETEIGEATGAVSQEADVEGEVEERLKELRILPPVLQQMTKWKPRAAENESDALKRVSDRLRSSGLDYHSRVVHAFHTAMKVNETSQMAVLAGISGTGKSQLPRQYAAAMGIGFLQVPVQPRWDSPQDLMGFYNYIEKRFRPTDMARALYQLDSLNNQKSELPDRMMMILLDEMNLARVEYYFSDFLSRLESRPPASRVGDKTLRKDAEIELELPMPKGRDAPRVFPGYNLLFAGTMNEDESTQSLSDKVVDRANVMRFSAPKNIHTNAQNEAMPEPEALSAARWRGWVRSVADVENDSLVRDSVERMVKLMKDFKRPVGHRLGRAIMAYVANYPGADRDKRIPLADQIEMRLLPKLRGLEVETNEATFSELRELVERGLQDDQLANAIEDSVRNAREGAGQFVWNGVTR
ncbi:chromosome segregation ATPase-like protein [Rhizobium ruizarguesonis]|uniref:chromosome segregation ATPase-like protein n=1 Tax=Rhizobium ruizarguesonis TaxID=2081791 RepID=UPI0013C0DEEA|nr:chromosome segregation ATPase-like protein [Rhizobium ruizarguesonis]NEJ00158.1 chromosome segregation ATPase-like protein [Rhizobium ruizarguesonis]NEJ37652.1 chromosome segregation ATPase-like protein [Rhizobium ruizarguesonis]